MKSRYFVLVDKHGQVLKSTINDIHGFRHIPLMFEQEGEANCACNDKNRFYDEVDGKDGQPLRPSMDYEVEQIELVIVENYSAVDVVEIPEDVDADGNPNPPMAGQDLKTDPAP